MTGLRWIVTVTLLVTLSLPALAASARKPILEMIPKDAAGFVVLRDLSQVDKATEILAAKIQFPITRPSIILKMVTLQELPVDMHGNLAVIYFVPEQVDKAEEDDYKSRILKSGVLLLPVKDDRKFQDILKNLSNIDEGLYEWTLFGTPMLLAPKDGYALLTAKKNREWLDRVLQFKTSIAAEVQPWKSWIDEQLAYCFLTKSLRTAYRGIFLGSMQKSNLKQLNSYRTFPFPGSAPLFSRPPEDLWAPYHTPDKEKTKNSISKDKLAIAQQESVDYIMKIYDSVDLLAIGVKINKEEAIYLTLRCGMATDSALSSIFSTRHHVPDDLLTSLPDEDFVLAGGKTTLVKPNKDFQTFWDNMYKSVPALQPKDPSLDENWMAFCYGWPDDYFEHDLQCRSFLLGVPREQQAAFENICAISWMADTDRGLHNIEKDAEVLKQWCEYFNKETGAPSFKSQTEKTYTEGQKTLAVSLDLSKYLEDKTEDLKKDFKIDNIEPLLEKVYVSKGQLREYNIQLDDRRILSTYCSDPKFRKTLLQKTKTSKGGFTERADVKPTLTMLPAEAQAKYFLSPCGMAKYIEWLMTMTVPIHDRSYDLDKLPKIKNSPSIGLATVATKELFEVTIVVTIDTLHTTIEYWTEIEKHLDASQPR
ncbi:MAG: hypothetical protein PVH19_10465 [Planctomycetia bacterium]